MASASDGQRLQQRQRQRRRQQQRQRPQGLALIFFACHLCLFMCTPIYRFRYRYTHTHTSIQILSLWSPHVLGRELGLVASHRQGHLHIELNAFETPHCLSLRLRLFSVRVKRSTWSATRHSKMRFACGKVTKIELALKMRFPGT